MIVLLQDFFRRDRRGIIFASQAAAAVAGITVGSLVTDIFAYENILSFAGWRVIFFLFALLSLTVSVVGFVFLYDPKRGQVELEEPSVESVAVDEDYEVFHNV